MDQGKNIHISVTFQQHMHFKKKSVIILNPQGSSPGHVKLHYAVGILNSYAAEMPAKI